MVYPHNLVGVDSGEELQLAINAWKERMDNSTSSYIWCVDGIQEARMGLGNDAHQQLGEMIGAKQKRITGYCYDGNGKLEAMGLHISTMNEMLLQSYDDVIRVFPAVPDNFAGAFTLLASGGFLVSSEYVDAAGNVLGVHKGHVCYTVGQRKGLGISLGKRAVVLSKDARANRVVLGDEADVYRREVSLSGISLPSDPHALDGVVRCEAKIRYAHRAACATFTRTGEDTGVLVFDEAVRAPSPGQFAVMYSDDCVIGAGVID